MGFAGLFNDFDATVYVLSDPVPIASTSINTVSIQKIISPIFDRIVVQI